MQHFAFLCNELDGGPWQAIRCTDYRDSVPDQDAPIGVGFNPWDAISNLCDTLSRVQQAIDTAKTRNAHADPEDQPAPSPAPHVDEQATSAADQAEEFEPKKVLEPPEYKPTPKAEITHHNQGNKTRKR
jgi:hypothetical protein